MSFLLAGRRVSTRAVGSSAVEPGCGQLRRARLTPVGHTTAFGIRDVEVIGLQRDLIGDELVGRGADNERPGSSRR